MGKFLVEDPGTVETESLKPHHANDDLQLNSLSIPEIPPNVLFPDQLNRYLREQIRNLSLENGNLRRSLQETQEELTASKLKLSKSPPTIPARSSEAAASKISELSKKLREQNAELETLRTRVKELESSLKQTEENLNQVQAPSPTPSQSELSEKDKQIKSLAEKLTASNSRMCDFRNQCQALKQEMKLAQKVIESEIGERIALQDLVKENGGWRGRAQQIIALQNKIQHLQEQLSSSSVTETTPAVNVIRQMEKDRRASYEETSKQLNQKTIQMEDLRKKLDAAKARNRVLENEIFQVKAKLSSLLDKSVRDEQLVAALNTQINAFEDRNKSQSHCFSRLQENVNKLQQELDLEKAKNEQLQKALIDRENRLRTLEDQTYEFRKNGRRFVHEAGDNLSNNRYYSHDKSTETSPSPTKLPASIIEMERLRLLELLTVVNRRLEEARKESIDAETQLRKEKSKNAKLETKIARLELERVGAVKTVRGNYNNKINDSLNENELATKHQIEYLEEECLALKTRIATLQMEKEDDLKLFTAMTEMRDHLNDGQQRNFKFKEDFCKKLNKRPNGRKSDTRLSFSSDETKSDFRYPL